jgi:hypothetical protein
MEKMYFEDRSRVLAAFNGCMDVEALPQLMRALTEQENRVRREKKNAGEGKKKYGQRSIFMDFYTSLALNHMKKYGSTQRQLAAISSWRWGRRHCYLFRGICKEGRSP